MKFRKKPVEIEAIQYTGKNRDEIKEWVSSHNITREVLVPDTDDNCPINIVTLEGVMMANPLDFLIIGIQGEVYPCKPDIFEATYEKVED